MNYNYGNNGDNNGNYGVNNNGYTNNYGNGYNNGNDYNNGNGYNNNGYNNNNNNMDPGYGMGLASLICGIIALILSWFFGSGLVLAILGLVFSVSSGNKSAMIGWPKNSMAKAGMICSSIALALSLLVLISCIACFGCVALDGYNSYYYDYYYWS